MLCNYIYICVCRYTYWFMHTRLIHRGSFDFVHTSVWAADKLTVWQFQCPAAAATNLKNQLVASWPCMRAPDIVPTVLLSMHPNMQFARTAHRFHWIKLAAALLEDLCLFFSFLRFFPGWYQDQISTTMCSAIVASG